MPQGDKTEEEEEEEEEEEMPDEIGKSYDTYQKGGRYARIITDPENDVIQIHTNGEILQGDDITNKIRRSDRNTNKQDKYGSIPYTEYFWIGLINKTPAEERDIFRPELFYNYINLRLKNN